MRDTLRDIRIYLEVDVEDLHVDDPADVEGLIAKILEKSRDSFLWTRLVLQRLANCWSRQAITEILEDVPEGMYQLYARILEDMSESPNQDLAKAILRWVICASRPLTMDELHEAIHLDIGQTVSKSKMIEGVW
jgi:hypothetical protein